MDFFNSSPERTRFFANFLERQNRIHLWYLWRLLNRHSLDKNQLATRVTRDDFLRLFKINCKGLANEDEATVFHIFSIFSTSTKLEIAVSKAKSFIFPILLAEFVRFEDQRRKNSLLYTPQWSLRFSRTGFGSGLQCVSPYHAQHILILPTFWNHKWPDKGTPTVQEFFHCTPVKSK